MKDNDDYVPFPEYPNVTVKDIRELGGRNMKPMTDKEKAKMIYMFREYDEMEINIKKCPFCGGKAIIHTSNFSGLSQIYCENDNCRLGMNGIGGKSKQEVIERWNTRITDKKRE